MSETHITGTEPLAEYRDAQKKRAERVLALKEDGDMRTWLLVGLGNLALMSQVVLATTGVVDATGAARLLLVIVVVACYPVFLRTEAHFGPGRLRKNLAGIAVHGLALLGILLAQSRVTLALWIEAGVATGLYLLTWCVHLAVYEHVVGRSLRTGELL